MSERKLEQGSMYIEAMIALTVLAMALIAIAPLFVLAARENAYAGELTVATTLAQAKAEQLTAEVYADLADDSDSVKVRDMRYERSWTVAADAPHPGIKTVTITVTPERPTAGPNTSATVSLYRIP